MAGIKFRINASFWVFIVVAVVFRQGYLATMYSIAVVLHETAHYLVARRLLYRCREIRLSVFGAVLYGDFQDVEGRDRIKIALAGPMCNFVLCLVCLALFWLFPTTYYYTQPFFSANLSMACVNLLPCYPLDGGRVLTGLLERRTKKALKWTKTLTFLFSGVAFLVFFVSLFTGHNLFSVGTFALMLFSGVLTTSGGECYTRALHSHRKIKKGMEKRTLVFDQNSTLRDVAKRILGNYLYCLEVVDADLKVKRTFDMAQLEQLVLEVPLDTALKNLP